MFESGLNKIVNNVYPGRGIIIGASADLKRIYQIYWIMGRSVNSRNRIFTVDKGLVRTEAFNPALLSDPSLVIYNAARNFNGNGVHIVTNGDQTDTIYNFLSESKTFEDALETRTFEPDAPNYTPRISAAVYLGSGTRYKISILKTISNNAENPVRFFYNYDSYIPSAGHCIHTYDGDGDPLPSFCGEPYIVPIYDTIEENAQVYWDALNDENKVSLFVKEINAEDKSFKYEIINKNN
jgi:IMP cyclohydrolase